jgi:hypothetical protein
MKKLAATCLIASALLSPLLVASPAAAKSCAMIRGSGLGVTESIARWMANKAVTDSAAKWAAGAAHKLGPVKLTCSGFSCQGAAKACK